jgi:4-amino-4-deoxy-L-arabinose transferase-like glycosyltransferase
VTRFGRILLLIVVVGFGVRVAYVAVAKDGPCIIKLADGTPVASAPSQCAVGDQIFYNSEANFVAKGHGFNEPLAAVQHPGTRPGPAADHPPLTVFVLTPVSWLVDHPPFAWFIDERLDDHVREHRYTMVVLGTLLILLVGLLGRRVGGDTVGLVAAGIAALSPNIWVNDGLVMSETITGLTVVGAMILALELRKRPTIVNAAALGFVCGFAALARAEMVLFIPLLSIAVPLAVRLPWRERVGLAAIASGLAVLALAPWVAFNMARFDQPTWTSTNDGIALLGSNCDTVYYGHDIGLTSISPGPRNCLQDPPPPGDQSDIAKVYRKRAFDYIGDHKSRLPIVVAARIGRTWGVYRPGDMVWFNEGEGRERWITRLGVIVLYPTLLLAIIGSVVLWRRRRRAELWILLVPAIVVTVGSALTYGQTRFRAAAEPSLAILAAVAVIGTVRMFTGDRAPTQATERAEPAGAMNVSAP